MQAAPEVWKFFKAGAEKEQEFKRYEDWAREHAPASGDRREQIIQKIIEAFRNIKDHPSSEARRQEWMKLFTRERKNWGQAWQTRKRK